MEWERRAERKGRQGKTKGKGGEVRGDGKDGGRVGEGSG